MFYNSLEELPNFMFAKSAKKKILLQQPLKLFIRSCFADFLFMDGKTSQNDLITVDPAIGEFVFLIVLLSKYAKCIDNEM